MITKPQYLIIVIILVAGLIGLMYMMKNVFHIPAYPEGRRSSAHDRVKSTPEKDEKADKSAQKDTIQFDSSMTVDDSSETDPDESKSIQDSPKNENPEAYFQQLLDDYKKSVSSKLAGKPNRSDIIVRYYPREMDYDKVKVLKELSLYIHKREVGKEVSKFPSNSIFYGDEVPTKDIQLVAYMLIQNGIPLKQIIPSKYHNDWKSRSIEIGADTSITNEMVMSLEDIKGFTNSFNQQEW